MVESITVDVGSFRKPKVEVAYPRIELLEINDTLPAVIKSLEQGELQVHATHKGETKVICSVSGSAYNIDKLLRTKQVVRYWVSESNYKDILTVMDYLEVL